MLRSAVYGLVLGLASTAACDPTILVAFICPWTAILAWPILLCMAAPLLVAASIPLSMLLWSVRPRVPSQIFGAVAIVLGIPFGFAVCWGIRGLLGLQGEPWSQSWTVVWIPAAFGAGIGLGLGGLRAISDDL